MIRLAVLVAAATPTPEPADVVSPGVVGFFAIFIVAGMTVLLILDMTRRVRRARYRAEVGALLDEEERRRDDPPVPE